MSDQLPAAVTEPTRSSEPTAKQLLLELPAIQQVALQELGKGSTIIDAAKAAGVHRQTVSTWIHEDPNFAAAYNAWCQEILDSGMAQVLAMSGACVIAMPSQKPSRRELMHRLAVVRADLREYRIRDAPDYAEVLIAEALGGIRVASQVNPGYDVVCERFGRIEVNSRQLPPDGRTEERVAVSESKESGFDFLAIVVFHPDFDIRGAVVAPYDSVWELIASQRYNRISYSQACGLRGAIDVTDRVREAARW
jgi:hypothetical protein